MYDVHSAQNVEHEATLKYAKSTIRFAVAIQLHYGKMHEKFLKCKEQLKNFQL